MRYTDVYLLKETVMYEDVIFFRRQYVNGFTQTVKYFEYPQFTTYTSFETDNLDKMIDFLLDSKGAYRFYFQSKDKREVSHAMIFFNKDGSIIFGLRVSQKYLEVYENRLMRDFQTDMILLCDETLPPDTAHDFKQLIGK